MRFPAELQELQPQPGPSPWDARFSDSARCMVPSEVRSLFSAAASPGIVSLAGGMPDVGALPMDTMASILADVVRENGTTALQYGTAQGDPGLRRRICEVMALEGITARPDDVMVTVGSQQALDLVARVLLDPGDTVVAEGPTYVTALGTFAAARARVVQIGMDRAGTVPEELAAEFARLAAEGRPAKLFYTVPTFQNPTGIRLAAGRRQQILDVCRAADVLVVEDNPYGLLHYDGTPSRALCADAPDRVVYLGSFSKTLAPGLRVGWVHAPTELTRKLVLAAESAMLSHSALTQLTVDRYLRTEPWQERLGTFRTRYRDRRDAMLRALTAYMPAGTSWTIPDGGFFIWVTLPDGTDSRELLPRALAAGVAFVPGTAFHADGRGARHARLSFSYPSPADVDEGIRRLASVLGEQP
ncbi:PLP-dependent aminotransferase family protein [Streptomyces blastmyceticus]|uniref:PLP-dependent aminotransferase family protein n=2 Tax=Streptomyces blastmyceticus TaxID=68180 RepID=A0ABN0Y203_9ACTN